MLLAIDAALAARWYVPKAPTAPSTSAPGTAAFLQSGTSCSVGNKVELAPTPALSNEFPANLESHQSIINGG